MPENSRPGDPHWEIRHLGAADAIEGYAGAASVLTGESFPLFVSTTSAGFRVTAFRLGWYGGDGARRVWRSGPLRGHRQQRRRPGRRHQHGADRLGSRSPRCRRTTGRRARTCSGWTPTPARSGMCRSRSAQPSTAGQVVIKNCVADLAGLQHLGRLRPVRGAPGAGDYGTRSLAVSLDRPYDLNGADMFLTYERNVVKLAERMGLPLAYADRHGHRRGPAPAGRGQRADLARARRVLDPGRTRARDRGPRRGRQPGVPRGQRDVPADQAGGHRLGATGWSSATRPVTRRIPMYGKDNALVTSDWREPPDPDPESSLIGTIYEGYPAVASYVVAAPDSWVFAGTGVAAGARFGQPGRHRVRPGQPGLPGAAADPGAVALAAGVPGASAASVIRPTTRTPAGPASSTRAPCAGWRRSTATARTACRRRRPAFVQQVTDERAPRLRRRPRRATLTPPATTSDAMHEYAGDPIGSSAGLQ